jgi:hypothetical protein
MEMINYLEKFYIVGLLLSWLIMYFVISTPCNVLMLIDYVIWN